MELSNKGTKMKKFYSYLQSLSTRKKIIFIAILVFLAYILPILIYYSNVHYDEFLFSISEEKKIYLVEGQVETELIEIFDNNNYSISDDSVLINENGKQWKLFEKNNIYSLRESGSRIDVFNESKDASRFYSRGNTIIKGNGLYNEVPTKTPPIINIIFIIPAFFCNLFDSNNYSLFFALYFAVFNFFTSVLLLLVFNRIYKKKSLLISLLSLITPIPYFSTVIMAQDEAIVAFFFFVPLCLILLNNKFSTIMIGLGIWIKIWCILLVPTLMLTYKGLNERCKHIFYLIFISFLIMLPFLIISNNGFINFLKLNSSGIRVSSSNGVSVWHWLNVAGYSFPNIYNIFVFLILLLISWNYANKRNFGVWKSTTIFVILFFMTYQKLHLGYYLIPIILLIVFGIDEIRMLLEIYLLSVFIGISHLYHYHEDYFSTDGGLIIIPLVSTIIVLIILYDLLIKVFNKNAYFEKTENLP